MWINKGETMNDEHETKGPGRPRKYATSADRKRAYRERKKEKLAQMQKGVARLESKVSKLGIAKERSDKLDSLLNEIETPKAKFAPSEIAEMENDELLELRDILRHWLQDHRGLGGIITQLSNALIPRTYASFEQLGLFGPVQEEEEGELKYIPSMIETVIDKKSQNARAYYSASSNRYSSGNLAELFEQITLLYLVEAEIAKRRRDKVEDFAIVQLETRIKELESLLEDNEEAKTEPYYREGESGGNRGDINE